MAGLSETAVVAAFNTLLEEQRKLNAAATKASFLLFNESCEIVFDGRPLVMAAALSPSTYHPSGSTALWDGIGTMIETIAARFDGAPVAAHSRVLVVTITDGAENASHRYELERLRKAIEYRQNACGWLHSDQPEGRCGCVQAGNPAE
jgi:hypothetical protein